MFLVQVLKRIGSVNHSSLSGGGCGSSFSNDPGARALGGY